MDVVTVAAGLGSGLEGCQPLFQARDTAVAKKTDVGGDRPVSATAFLEDRW